jgi:alkylhydroperoxidase/carboxymuconolactone decarboxylase family protein YurZ
MAEYQTPKDRTYTDSLIKSAPKEAAAFLNLKHIAERKDGVISIKYRELMSVAVAMTTQCAYWGSRCKRANLYDNSLTI